MLTADETARANYARIAEEATVLLYGDILGYHDGLEPTQRIPVAYRGDTCSMGFVGLARPSTTL